MEAQLKILGPQFSTFVRSVMIACEEKGISYRYGMKIEGQPIGLDDETHRQYHPYGKIPVLILEDGRSICETASIIRFLDSEFAGTPLQPEDNYLRAEVDQWTNLINIYIDQALVRKFLLEFVFPKGENGTVRMDKVKAALPDVKRALEVLADKLGENDFICGKQFSMADIVLAPMLDYLAKHPMAADILEGKDRLSAYLMRLRQRSSCQKVLI